MNKIKVLTVLLMICCQSSVAYQNHDRVVPQMKIPKEQAVFLNKDLSATTPGRKRIALGYKHTCVNDDESFKCWASHINDSYYGQEDVPLDALHPSEVAAFAYNTCVIVDGTVKCWGEMPCEIGKDKAECKRLRDGDVRPLPVKNPKQISISREHGCVVDDDGVKCWGNNYFNQASVPPGLVQAKEVSLHYMHTCAIDQLGVKCWGLNNFGQTNVPPDLKNPTKISVGLYHTCAIADGGVKCWGKNDQGQTDVPAGIKNPKFIVSSLGSCVLDDEGIKCWGWEKYLLDKLQKIQKIQNPKDVALSYGYSGDLCLIDDFGFRCTQPSHAKPRMLINPTEFSAGAEHQCVLVNKEPACWGRDIAEVGLGPVQHVFKDPYKLSTSLSHHSCVLDEEKVKCWGYNNQGQINVPLGIKKPFEVTAGSYHTCVNDEEGVKCFGSNVYGQTNVPQDLKNPQKLSNKGYYNCVIDEGDVKCWGRTANGGTAQVPTSLNKPVLLGLAFDHVCVVDADGIKCRGWENSDETILFSKGIKNPTKIITESEGPASTRHLCMTDDDGLKCILNRLDYESNTFKLFKGLKGQVKLQTSQYGVINVIDDEGLKYCSLFTDKPCELMYRKNLVLTQ